MDPLINYLLQFGELTPPQIEMVKSKAKKRELRKNSYFSEAGKVAQEVAYVVEGVLRVGYYNKEGLELTKYFVDENNFAVDLSSYSSQTPSTEYIQAVTRCKLIILSRAAFKELSADIAGWDALIKNLTAKSLLDKVNRISPMLAEDATSRYGSFLEKFPQVANRVPLSMLASYLGITPSSLSRIRKHSRKPAPV